MDSNALRGAALAADATSSTALFPAARTAPTLCCSEVINPEILYFQRMKALSDPLGE